MTRGSGLTNPLADPTNPLKSPKPRAKKPSRPRAKAKKKERLDDLDDDGNSEVFLFAYDSHISVYALTRKGIDYYGAEAGYLYGWQLEWNVTGPFSGFSGLFPNVSKRLAVKVKDGDMPYDISYSVQGVIYKMTKKELEKLDRIEGMSRSDQLRTFEVTSIKTAKKYQARVYVCERDHLLSKKGLFSFINRKYVLSMIEGATHHGLTKEYIEYLEKVSGREVAPARALPETYRRPPKKPDSEMAFTHQDLAAHRNFTSIKGIVFDASNPQPDSVFQLANNPFFDQIFGGKDVSLFLMQHCFSNQIQSIKRFSASAFDFLEKMVEIGFSLWTHVGYLVDSTGQIDHLVNMPRPLSYKDAAMKVMNARRFSMNPFGQAKKFNRDIRRHTHGGGMAVSFNVMTAIASAFRHFRTRSIDKHEQRKKSMPERLRDVVRTKSFQKLVQDMKKTEAEGEENLPAIKPGLFKKRVKDILKKKDEKEKKEQMEEKRRTTFVQILNGMAHKPRRGLFDEEEIDSGISGDLDAEATKLSDAIDIESAKLRFQKKVNQLMLVGSILPNKDRGPRESEDKNAYPNGANNEEVMGEVAEEDPTMDPAGGEADGSKAQEQHKAEPGVDLLQEEAEMIEEELGKGRLGKLFKSHARDVITKLRVVSGMNNGPSAEDYAVPPEASRLSTLEETEEREETERAPQPTRVIVVEDENVPWYKRKKKVKLEGLHDDIVTDGLLVSHLKRRHSTGSIMLETEYMHRQEVDPPEIYMLV